MGQNKRHHYNSEFYLNYFVDKNCGERQKLLWRYEKGKETPITISPNDTSVIKYYYTIEEDDGKKSNKIEIFLSDLENRTAPIIQRISESIAVISDNDINELLYFMAFMYTRIPQFRDNIEKFLNQILEVQVKMLAVHAEDWWPEMKKNLNDDSMNDVSSDEIKKIGMNRTNYDVQIHPNETLKAMLHSVSTIFNIVSKMNWGIIRSISPEVFITSDSPVVLVRPGPQTNMPIGFGSRDAEVTFPLTPTLCMFGGWKSKPRAFAPVPVPDVFVKEINRRTIDAAYKYVYASYQSEDIINRINLL